MIAAIWTLVISTNAPRLGTGNNTGLRGTRLSYWTVTSNASVVTPTAVRTWTQTR